MVVSRDVIFDKRSAIELQSELEATDFDFSGDFKMEDNTLGSLDFEVDHEDSVSTTDENNQNGEEEHETGKSDESEQPQEPIHEYENSGTEISQDSRNETPEIEELRTILRSGHVSKPPKSRWKSFLMPEQHIALLSTGSREIPNLYKQAISGPDAKFWQKGIDSEIESLKK